MVGPIERLDRWIAAAIVALVLGTPIEQQVSAKTAVEQTMLIVAGDTYPGAAHQAEQVAGHLDNRVTMVPLPIAAWIGLCLLGSVGMANLTRRRAD